MPGIAILTHEGHVNRHENAEDELQPPNLFLERGTVVDGGRIRGSPAAARATGCATTRRPANRESGDGAASVPSAQGRRPAAERACGCRDRSSVAPRAEASRRSPSRWRRAAPPPLATRR